jgi:hypothetical protein
MQLVQSFGSRWDSCSARLDNLSESARASFAQCQYSYQNLACRYSTCFIIYSPINVTRHSLTAKGHSRALERRKTRAMLFPTSVHRFRGKVFRSYRFDAVWQPCSIFAVCKVRFTTARVLCLPISLLLSLAWYRYFCLRSLLLFRRWKCPTSVDQQGYQVSSAVHLQPSNSLD